MIENDEQRIALRPVLTLKTNLSKPEEVFQNTTLRPILKMQHPLLIQVFYAYILKRRDTYFRMAKKDQMDWITDSVRSDLRLRNQLCGMIIGHFTTEELAIFLENEPDMVRRLTAMLIERLQSETFVQGTKGSL
jgi:hypothetical protein